jgi:rhodanese-related sulfurtransferase
MARDLLLFVFKKRCDDRLGWEEIISPQPDTVIIDLRQAEDYEHFSLPGSINLPVVKPECKKPFSDVSTLASLWSDLNSMVQTESSELFLKIRGKRSLALCYNGDSARVATSVLWGNGHDADSIRGGIEAVHHLSLSSEPVPNGVLPQTTHSHLVDSMRV